MSSPTFELKDEIVRAGAGAGKTTLLTKRVLDVAQHFFDTHKRAPKIVVTTFTRKATEELRERLVREACQLNDVRLIDFVTSRSNLHISTIHGVLAIFLRRLGHWLDIDSGFKVLDETSAARIARSVLREILVGDNEFQVPFKSASLSEGQSYEELLEDFTFNQLCEIVRDSLPRDATPVTAAKLRELLQTEYRSRAEKLYAVNKNILAETGVEKWFAYCEHVQTCAKYLRQYKVQAEAQDAFSIQDWVSSLDALEKPRFMSKNSPFSLQLHEELKAALEDCEELASEEFSAATVERYAERTQVFAELKKEFDLKFSERKLQSGQIEIDDLEQITLRTLHEHPEVAQAFSADWDYWLIDEFQDTSPVQVEILNGLVGRKPVFVVGDPQQSIYLFRGARSTVFTQKEAAVLAAGGERSELMKNYRSRPELLLFFNEFFAHLSPAFAPMVPKEAPLSKVTTGVADQTSTMADIAQFFAVGEDDEQPYACLADSILKKVALGEHFDNFCVLARTNGELLAVAQYFESLNVPTHVHSSDGFYGRREVLDALSLLKFLLNPHDNKNLLRVLRSPWFRVPDQELAQALAEKPAFYWVELQKSRGENGAIKKLSVALKSKTEKGIFETLRETLFASGLIDASHTHDSTGRRESNIWKFLAFLREQERSPGFSYMAFVQNALRTVEGGHGESESDAVAALEPNRVNLMTIHKAKGLKFKHVLVPNLDRRLSTAENRKHTQFLVCDEETNQFTLALRLGEERKFIHNLAARRCFEKIAEAEREEHLRLLYVALTRAVESVTMQWQAPLDKTSWAAMLVNHYKAEDVSQMTLEPYQESASATREPRAPWDSKENSGSTQSAVESSKRISVTKLLEEKYGVESKAISTGQLQQKIEAPVFGQRLHSFFESLKYRDESFFDVETGRLISDGETYLREYSDKWFSKKSREFEKAVHYVLALKEPPVAQLIRDGEVEWGFQLKRPKTTSATESESENTAPAVQIVEGQIDLWGTVDGVTWVIDYKSGSSLYKEKALDQLRLYAEAIRARGVTTEIRLAVIYALEGKVDIAAL